MADVVFIHKRYPSIIMTVISAVPNQIRGKQPKELRVPFKMFEIPSTQFPHGRGYARLDSDRNKLEIEHLRNHNDARGNDPWLYEDSDIKIQETKAEIKVKQGGVVPAPSAPVPPAEVSSKVKAVRGPKAGRGK